MTAFEQLSQEDQLQVLRATSYYFARTTNPRSTWITGDENYLDPAKNLADLNKPIDRAEILRRVYFSLPDHLRSHFEVKTLETIGKKS
jgi:hypothetical protein